MTFSRAGVEGGVVVVPPDGLGELLPELETKLDLIEELRTGAVDGVSAFTFGRNSM